MTLIQVGALAFLWFSQGAATKKKPKAPPAPELELADPSSLQPKEQPLDLPAAIPAKKKKKAAASLPASAPVAESDLGADLPLAAPVLVATKKKTSELPPPADAPRNYGNNIVLGGSASGFAGSGQLRAGFNARLTLGIARPSKADHLGLTLEPNFSYARNGETSALTLNAYSQVQLFSLPVLLSLNFDASPVLVRVSAGPSFDFYSLERHTAARTAKNSGVGGGFDARLGLLLYFSPQSPNAIGLDLGYHYAPYKTFTGNSDSSIFLAGVSFVTFF